MSVSSEQQRDIEELWQQQAPTRRAVVPALEEILYQPLAALDKGFVRVIDYMGDDAAIVQAARVSYGRGTKQVSDDRGLINYLMRMRHTSPFEMCELKLHVKLPIFVARQWIRHRTANVNEYSARYSVLQDEFYLPAAEHLAVQSSGNRQGRGEVLEGRQAAEVQGTFRRNAEGAYERYLGLLNQDDAGQPLEPDRAGLARELARMVLPLNTYTEWYWKTDLHNLLHFVTSKPSCTVRDPRLCRGAPGRGPALGAADLRGIRGLPPERCAALGQSARGGPSAARGGAGRAGRERA